MYVCMCPALQLCVLMLQISNSLLTYLLVLLVSFIVSFIVTWPLIITTILSYWRVILVLLIPVLIQSIIVRKIIGYTILTNASGVVGPFLPYILLVPRGWSSFIPL